MKTIFAILFVCSSIHLFAQSKVTDFSPDGRDSITYILSTQGSGFKVDSDVPFGTQPSWQSTLDRQVGGLVFGDYDNDGDLDLAVGNYFSNSYPPINEYETQIYRNDNGTLTTTPAWVSTDMRSTTDVRWADVNKDGFIDLLAANGNQSLVPSVIYFISPSGLETTPSWVSNDQNWTVGAAFCDVDGDRDLDLVFANQGETNIPTRPINILFNNNGVLSTTPGWASADQMITNTVAMADLNNYELTSEAKEFSASGIGGVFHLPFVPVYSVDSIIVNGNITNDFCSDAISGWVSLGFTPTQGSIVRIVYTYMPKADMGACKWVNYQSGVYYNFGGTMGITPTWTVGNTNSQKGMAWADYNLDGYLDLAIGGSGVATVLYINSHGALINSPVWSSASANNSTQDLIWGDVNKDGYPDLTLVHFGSRRVEIFINRAGFLDTEPTWTYNPATSSTAIAYGDVNGDGWLDLAVGTARTPVLLFLADPAIIPVELNSFNSLVEDNLVNLKWSTTTETNNKGFEIERNVSFQTGVSNNQAEWSNIGYVEGKGTSTRIIEYNFTDMLIQAGKYQYRLKQIDFDGSFKYSRVLDIDYAGPSGFFVEQNYPNPFNPSTKIKYITPTESYITLSIYDVLGSEVKSIRSGLVKAGTHEVNISASELSSGIYFYQVKMLNAKGNIYSSTKKMIIAK